MYSKVGQSRAIRNPPDPVFVGDHPDCNANFLASKRRSETMWRCSRCDEKLADSFGPAGIAAWGGTERWKPRSSQNPTTQPSRTQGHRPWTFGRARKITTAAWPRTKGDHHDAVAMVSISYADARAFDSYVFASMQLAGHHDKTWGQAESGSRSDSKLRGHCSLRHPYRGPKWLEDMFGKSFFADVTKVDLTNTDADDAALGDFASLSELRYLNLGNT